MNFSTPVVLNSGAIALLKTRERNQSDLLYLSGALALQNGATVIDGGNHFNAYVVTGYVRCLSVDLLKLDLLQVARVFNCHQLLTLLRQVPMDGTPCLVIDLLDTFSDDSILLEHRLRLLSEVVKQLKVISQFQPVVISLSPPKDKIDQWYYLAELITKLATLYFEEGFMGKTIPTINQIVHEAEVILARFSKVVQSEEREALEELFVGAKKHIAAISEANHLLPFEVVQQAMLLEQQKEILYLKKHLSSLESRLD